jgi:hypothetical protein
MNQSRSHWVRMFKIPYRKTGDTLIREENVKCETVKNALHKPGEKSHLATDTLVTVQIVIPYFDDPKTEDERADADQLYVQAERDADKYLKLMYPDFSIS